MVSHTAAVEQAGKYGMTWISMAATNGDYERSIGLASSNDYGGI